MKAAMFAQKQRVRRADVPIAPVEDVAQHHFSRPRRFRGLSETSPLPGKPPSRYVAVHPAPHPFADLTVARHPNRKLDYHIMRTLGLSSGKHFLE
jgi:hypothetical protein